MALQMAFEMYYSKNEGCQKNLVIQPRALRKLHVKTGCKLKRKIKNEIKFNKKKHFPFYICLEYTSFFKQGTQPSIFFFWFPLLNPLWLPILHFDVLQKYFTLQFVLIKLSRFFFHLQNLWSYFFTLVNKLICMLFILFKWTFKGSFVKNHSYQKLFFLWNLWVC